jgi:hypothetical protein
MVKSFNLPGREAGICANGSQYRELKLKLQEAYSMLNRNLFCSVLRKALFSFALLLSLAVVPVVAQQPGDVNGDRCVDDADLLAVLFAFGSTGTGMIEDMNHDGVVDDADLLLVLFNFGACAPPNTHWQLQLTPMTIRYVTPAGNRGALINGGLLNFEITPPGDGGYSLVHVENFSIGSNPITVGTQTTGGITILPDNSQEMHGSWHPESDSFVLHIPVKIHYPLLNSFIPPLPSDGQSDDNEEVAFEFGSIYLIGTATITGPSSNLLQIQGTIMLEMQQPISGAINGANIPLNNAQADRKDPLENCPEDKTVNKRKVCIQPIFIGTGANDPNKTGASYEAMKREAEAVWAKACVELVWNDPQYINNNAYKEIEKFDENDGYDERTGLLGEVDSGGTNDCIEVYFVTTFKNANGDKHAAGDGVTRGAGTKSAKIIVADDAVSACDPDSDRVLAHELGHALGDLPHDHGTCMQATGNPPNCPGRNPDTLKKAQAKGLNNPLLKPKDPKERCCINVTN